MANSVGDAFHNAFHVPTVITGIFLAILSGFIFFGGVKRITSITKFRVDKFHLKG